MSSIFTKEITNLLLLVYGTITKISNKDYYLNSTLLLVMFKAIHVSMF